MYGLVYSNMLDYAKKEGFAGGTSNGGAVIVALLAMVVLIVVQLFIVMWLWNNVLTKVVSFAKPIPSLWYALGLLILVAMILPGQVSAAV
jgi:hypothetical protein